MDKTLQVKVYDRDSLPTEDVIILVVSVAGCGVDTTYWCKRLIENFIFFYEIFLVFYFSHVLFISLFEYRYGWDKKQANDLGKQIHPYLEFRSVQGYAYPQDPQEVVRSSKDISPTSALELVGRDILGKRKGTLGRDSFIVLNKDAISSD